MSIKLKQINGTELLKNKREYLCDTVEDIALLPTSESKGSMPVDPLDLAANDVCDVGSTAFVCATGETYILAPSNEWVVKQEAPADNVATKDYVDKKFENIKFAEDGEY